MIEHVHLFDPRLPDRFWDKVQPEPNSGCWLWVGSASGDDGYGGFHFNGKLRRAHRVAYEHCVGPIPAGMHVCHRCDTPACVNPDHLWLGTDADNVRDMIAKGRGTPREPKVTHCKNGHAYNEQNTRIKFRRDGRAKRCCRRCHADEESARYYRRV